MVVQEGQRLRLAAAESVALLVGEIRILLVVTQIRQAPAGVLLVLKAEQVARFQPVAVPVMEMSRAVEALVGHKYLEEVVEQGDLVESYLRGR
jgi:hypothetical protein